MTLVKRLGVAMAILAALVAAVEIAAGVTRASHNRAVRHLGDKLHVFLRRPAEVVGYIARRLNGAR